MIDDKKLLSKLPLCDRIQFSSIGFNGIISGPFKHFSVLCRSLPFLPSSTAEKMLMMIDTSFTLCSYIKITFCNYKMFNRLSIINIPPSNLDIVLGDEEFSLSEYGIPGRILYTPGHLMGSVSVLLDTGDAFVGDLAMSGLPMRLTPGLPALAEDMQKVMASWQLLIKAGAKTIYPAHGKPFSVDIIQRALL
jgi:hypothetical protein